MIPEPGLELVPCHSYSAGEGLRAAQDRLAVEEPLEIRLAGEPVATVMRTPGHDRDLAVGFLFDEGLIGGLADIGSLAIGSSGGSDPAGNVADLIPPTVTGASPRRAGSIPSRRMVVSSSCGVCGKRTIEEVLASVPPPGFRPREGEPFEADVLRGLPAALRAGQRLFESTGALHAAGLFDRQGRLLLLREDVGRHNAVDKVVGASLLRGEVPLADRALLVSGRAGFEILQKSLRAGIALVAAVSGVSTLARDLAEAGDITLVGFLRGATFQVYSHPRRLRG